MNPRDAIHLSREQGGATARQRGPGRRFLLYSHDSYGLGHLRRNLGIAGALLNRDPEASALIVTGSPCATQFPPPPRCEIVKIPAIGKDEHGGYQPRFLDVPLHEAVALRRQLIFDTYRAFRPDLLVVDHQPAGLMGEMLDTLKHAAENGVPSLFGMRDIVDAPAAVEAAWNSRECLQALRDYYDTILVYGDRTVYDPLQEYAVLADVAHKVAFTGYLAPAPRHSRRENGREKLVLVTVGGGDDGAARIETYLDTLEAAHPTWRSVIVTGPLMPGGLVRRFKRRARHNGLAGRVRLYRFHGDVPGLLHQSDAVVAMAGYNSCVEILQAGTPAVLMPREHMRQEQSLRARRLEELGLVNVAATGDAAGLGAALERCLESGRASHALDMNGLRRLCRHADQLTGRAAARSGESGA